MACGVERGRRRCPTTGAWGKGQTMAKEEINEKTACITKHESYTEKVVIWIIASLPCDAIDSRACQRFCTIELFMDL
jgi:hypothetical protein